MRFLLTTILSLLLLTSPLSGQKETKVVEKKRMFVTVGWDGTILTSSDGTTWTSRTSGTSNSLRDVTYSQ